MINMQLLMNRNHSFIIFLRLQSWDWLNEWDLGLGTTCELTLECGASEIFGVKQLSGVWDRIIVWGERGVVVTWTFVQHECRYNFRVETSKKSSCEQAIVLHIRATSHTRLRAHHEHYTSSTLVGGKGKAGSSLLHTTLEGPTEWICECKVDVKSTRIPTWHWIDHASWSLGLFSNTASWR